MLSTEPQQLSGIRLIAFRNLQGLHECRVSLGCPPAVTPQSHWRVCYILACSRVKDLTLALKHTRECAILPPWEANERRSHP